MVIASIQPSIFWPLIFAMCPFGSTETTTPSSLYFSIGAFGAGFAAFCLHAHSAKASSNIERNLCTISLYYC